MSVREQYKHLDYWLSSLLMWGCAYGITFELLYAWKRGSDCLTGRQVIVGLAIFAGSIIVSLAATGWTVYVVEKYNPRQRLQQGVTQQ